jgi:hypothetical protein
MKKNHLAIPGIVLILVLTGCNLLKAGTPTPLATLIIVPSPTLAVASPTFTTAAPTATVSVPLPSPSPTTGSPEPAATATATTTSGGGSGSVPGLPSGPYAVILVESSDVLNIRSGPGVGSQVNGSFPATSTTVMRTGPSSIVDGDLWVEVQKPGGGNGWVNSAFLTEYVAPASFCANTAVNNLITSLDTALTTNNGVALAGLVSPKHGMTVYLWRYGNSVTFDSEHARWVFESTYEHNWGEAPGSGLETVGPFHEEVLPFLQEVFNANYTLTCDSLGSAPQYGLDPWPVSYTNVNYYTVFKPGTTGVDLDFRFFLVGVEFVQGQPYVFALIHVAWEP